MTDAIDISVGDHKLVLGLLKQHLPNVAVWAYGSRVKWTARPQSDLDLVAFTSCEQKAAVFNLREALEESSLPFPVDLFIWDELPESFRKQIEAEHVVLVAGKEKDVRGGWKTVTLGEFAPFTYGKGLPVGKRNPSGVIPVFGSNGIVGYHDSSLTDGPTIIIGRKGTVGAVHYSPIPCWPIDTTFFITGNDPTLVKFKYYALSMLGLERMNSDSAVPSLNRSDAHARTLLLPGESEQRAIAHILGTLDDKIELNRRMNETLEEMARALFKSWFVDFDPVRAKMEGGDTGLPPDVDALFPDRLVDSELGEIPEGREIGCLADIAVAPRRGVDPTSLHNETPYIGLEHMPRRSIALTQWEGTEKVTSSKSIFKKGDFLFGKLRPYFHKVGIAPVSGICSTDVIVVAPKASQWSAFVLASISSDEFIAYANQTSTGTRMPRTSWKTISEYRICLPSAHAVQAFQDAIQPMIDGIVANVHGSHTLAALRNTLLPKLVSGELRVVESMGREGLYHYS